MIVGERIRALREEKKLTRGDLQERTGLQRTYIWRVENGKFAEHWDLTDTAEVLGKLRGG